MPNLPRLRDDRDFSLGVFSPDLQETPAGKPRRSRLLAFFCVCLPALVLGLAYTPRTLRHTYLVYLLRQGIRFADVGRIAGRLPQEELAAYMRFAPSQPRQPLEQIELVLPALREMTG